MAAAPNLDLWPGMCNARRMHASRPAPRIRAQAALLALLALLGVGCGETRASDDRPPNLLLVSFDTLRPDRLSTYGHRRPTSPTVDGLAEQGVRFESAYSHSPKTGPSHMSILTGLLPDAHGVRNLGESGNRRLPTDVPTLASVLADRGYRTAAFTAGGHVSASLGFSRGFERFEESGGIRNSFKWAAEQIGDYAGEPWFVFLHTYEIHDPYTPPSGFRERWTEEDYAGRILGSRDELIEAAGGEWKEQHEEFWSRVDDESDADLDHLLGLYDGSIRFADKQFGELLEKVEQAGELENTLIVVLSDHGEEFREHGGWLHESVYDEILRVPLIVRFPAGVYEEFHGRQVDDVARLVDVLPTVLEVLAVEAPFTQGSSLVPVIEGNDTTPRPVLSHWPRKNMYALRSEDWKLIAQLEEDGTLRSRELYQIDRDERERRDLAEKREPLADRMEESLRDVRSMALAMLDSFERGVPVDLDPEKAAELAALGYLDPAAVPGAAASASAGDDD